MATKTALLLLLVISLTGNNYLLAKVLPVCTEKNKLSFTVRLLSVVLEEKYSTSTSKIFRQCFITVPDHSVRSYTTTLRCLLCIISSLYTAVSKLFLNPLILLLTIKHRRSLSIRIGARIVLGNSV